MLQTILCSMQIIGANQATVQLTMSTVMSHNVPYIEEPDVQTGQIWCESSGVE